MGYIEVVAFSVGVEKINEIAADQWGLITRSQMIDVGIPRTTLERLTGSAGMLVRVATGIYRVTGAPIPSHLELRAAWMQLEPKMMAWNRSIKNGVVSHRSAASLYGVGHLPADVHEFTSLIRKQTRRSDVRIHLRSMNMRELATVEGLVVTRPARIVTDLIRDKEDIESIAQIVADSIRKALETIDGFADALTLHANSFGFSPEDGSALVNYFLDIAGASDIYRLTY